MQNVLTELVKIEMVYHAKALEYLSKCFENMQQISVEGDLDVSVYDVSGLGCVCMSGGGGW